MNYWHYLKKILQHKKTSSFLGVDIGQTAISFFELAKTKQNYEIIGFATAKIPALIEKENNESILIDIIKTTLQQTGIKTNVAATALPNTLVITKVVSLDKTLTTNDIDQHIMLEAEKYFGSHAQTLYWDFAILGQSSADERKKDVQLIAAKKAIVQQRVRLLQQAGLQVKSIDVEAFALARIANLLKLENVTLLHLHDNRLLLVAIKQQRLIFIEEIFLDWQKLQPINVAIAVEHQLNLIAQHVPAEQIILSGNYPDLTAIADCLHTQRYQPIVANPFVQMSCGKIPGHFASFALSCGLALWNFV